MSRPNFFEHLHPPTIPAREARFTFTFGLGGMSLLLFLSLIVTGVPLMFVYTPTAVSAATSIRTITYVAPYGWLLRNLHYWAAVLLLLTGSLHLLRIVFSGSYKKPRQFNWLLGLIILFFSLLLSFSGYVLRWDVDTYGALTVGTHIAQQFPVIGDWLYRILVGGADISDTTLVRFYTWHTLGLVVPALLLMGWHAFRVRRDGGISHEAATTLASKPPRISRRELVRREEVAALALLCLLFLLALFWDAPLAAPVNLLTGPSAEPAHIAAPWFFLWIQALLRIWSPLLAGILIPLGVTLLLALLPWVLDRHEEGTAVWFHPSGRWAQLVVIVITVGIIILTVMEWRQ
ncbi:MAG: cytochrome b N-terminal domain-containing protein [Chloroflexota bacterium]|nr:cytochrome bc complex cytochrome b subunit [Ardenticatenaceae bacterium]